MDSDETKLAAIATRTLAHYAHNAQAFWEGTRDHDVTQNIAALRAALAGAPPRRILDLGCGPGRDLAALRALGEAPVGLDGCAELATMARAHSGCDVMLQSFFELSLPELAYDGVFANASLFHVPRALLPGVLNKLFAALVPAGVLFCSNPRAFERDAEGWQGARYGCYLTPQSWRELIAAAGFQLEHAYLRPTGRPEAEQPWLAMVWRKPA